MAYFLHLHRPRRLRSASYEVRETKLHRGRRAGISGCPDCIEGPPRRLSCRVVGCCWWRSFSCRPASLEGDRNDHSGQHYLAFTKVLSRPKRTLDTRKASSSTAMKHLKPLYHKTLRAGWFCVTRYCLCPRREDVFYRYPSAKHSLSFGAGLDLSE